MIRRLHWLIYSAFIPLYAQTGQELEREFFEGRGCTSVMYSNEKRNAGQKESIRIPDFEKEMARLIAEKKNAMTSNRAEEKTYVIPVVVHVLHKGESIGEGTNISYEQIQSQIDVLNEDFNRREAGQNDHPNGADINITFVLADFNPDGVLLNEPGVDRIYGGEDNWTLYELNTTMKPASIDSKIMLQTGN